MFFIYSNEFEIEGGYTEIQIPKIFRGKTGLTSTGGSLNILASARSPTKWGFIHKSVS